jgi:hypothetical protein
MVGDSYVAYSVTATWRSPFLPAGVLRVSYVAYFVVDTYVAYWVAATWRTALPLRGVLCGNYVASCVAAT